METLSMRKLQRHHVPSGSIALWWLGQAGLLIKSPAVLTDLMRWGLCWYGLAALNRRDAVWGSSGQLAENRPTNFVNMCLAGGEPAQKPNSGQCPSMVGYFKPDFQEVGNSWGGG